MITRRIILSTLALTFAALFGLSIREASAQVMCTRYTVHYDSKITSCLPIQLKTFWNDPPNHVAWINVAGTSWVYPPSPPGVFKPPFGGVSMNNGPVVPLGGSWVGKLSCGQCAKITPSLDANGCLVITIVWDAGPC